jgi:hypothetical protein
MAHGRPDNRGRSRRQRFHRLPSAQSRRADRRLPRQHLDFRAAGGCGLVPPSQIGDRPYRLIRLGTRSVGLSWFAVTEFLEPRRKAPERHRLVGSGRASWFVEWVGRLQPGNRNCGLFWAACEPSNPATTASSATSPPPPRRPGCRTGRSPRSITSARRAAHI